MKRPFKTISLLAASALFAFNPLAAVETDPVGYKTVTIKGDNSITLLGIEFLEAPEFAGSPSSSGTSSITVSGQDFDSLLDSGETYFVEVTSGSNEGINTTITSWSGSTLNLLDDLSALGVDSNSTVSVHRLPTIGQLFGVGGDVVNGGSASNADLIFFPGAGGELKVCYYSTGGLLGTGWRVVGEGTTDQGNLPIYYSDGIYILKKSTGDSELVVSGTVKTTRSSVVVEEGFVPYSTIFPSGTTLGNSGLYDASNPAESIAAGSASTADLVFADTVGDGELEIYYYSSGGLVGEGWREIGSGTSDASGVELPSGIGILNRNAAVAVNRSPNY